MDKVYAYKLLTRWDSHDIIYHRRLDYCTSRHSEWELVIDNPIGEEYWQASHCRKRTHRDPISYMQFGHIDNTQRNDRKYRIK